MSEVICKSPTGEEFPVDTSQLTWRPSAYAVIIKDGKVLLSPQFDDRYDLPGGGVDLGETFEQAVIREVREETGLIAADPSLLGCDTSFFRMPGTDKHYQTIMLYYSCIIVGGELSTDGLDEHEKKYARLAEWVPVEKLDEIKLASTNDFRKYIKQAKEVVHADSGD